MLTFLIILLALAHAVLSGCAYFDIIVTDKQTDPSKFHITTDMYKLISFFVCVIIFLLGIISIML